MSSCEHIHHFSRIPRLFFSEDANNANNQIYLLGRRWGVERMHLTAVREDHHARRFRRQGEFTFERYTVGWNRHELVRCACGHWCRSLSLLRCDWWVLVFHHGTTARFVIVFLVVVSVLTVFVHSGVHVLSLLDQRAQHFIRELLMFLQRRHEKLRVRDARHRLGMRA